MAKDGWISVEERLPEIGVRVWGSIWAQGDIGSERIQMEMYRGEAHHFGEWWREMELHGDAETYTPTHWMPLPPPPQDSGGEG